MGSRLASYIFTTYGLEALRGQQIKLIHTVSNNKFHESLSLKTRQLLVGQAGLLVSKKISQWFFKRKKALELLCGPHGSLEQFLAVFGARAMIMKKQSPPH